uniref:Reverse transcriptase domain-containing protein n=1 Tax=Tanacetum cinerariifolium TaxID=118510 RepID=A0A6L2NIB0_TANCI|nr:hypothetical protein [Tanacetum cinerariifolium]
MQTRSSSRLTRDQSSNPTASTNTTSKGHNHKSSKQKVENSNLEEYLPPVVTMADNRTMAELLRAPTEGQSANECCDYRHDGYAQIIQATPPPAPVKLLRKFVLLAEVLIRITSVLSPVATLSQNSGIISKDTFQQPQSITIRTQTNMVKNELRTEMKSPIQTSLSNQTNEIKNMMASLLQMNTASTSRLGSLPSNTVANPKGELKAITTRSGLVTDEPTIPIPPKSITPEVDERVGETYTDPDLTEYTINVPPPPVQKYKPPSQREFVVHKRDPLHPNIPYPSRMLKQKQQEKNEKMLKALLSNKEKLQELANTPLNENCSAVILKKLPEKLRDPGKFLIPCGFSELKCKALADLGASINLMPLSVWKELGLPELISTRMTLELANRAICTPAGIARDVFVLVGKFTFQADFVIVDYESDPRVPLILGRPFLWTARALIDVHGEEMILRDGDERLTLNMKHDTSSYSNQPLRESVNLINIFNVSSEDFLEVLFSNQPSGNPTFSSHQELTSPKVTNDIFDSKGCNVLSEKLPDLSYTKDLHPSLDDNLLSGSTTYSSNSFLKEFTDELALITYTLEYDDNLSGLDAILIDPILEMFTDEHTLDYSSPLKFDVYDDDFLEVESDAENVYDDPFDSNGEKIKESKLLIDELDLSCDFLPPFEYDSFISQDFSRVDALPSTNNEDKDKKLAISNASLVLEDFDPPFYETLFFKEITKAKMLLIFSSENEEKNSQKYEDSRQRILYSSLHFLCLNWESRIQI